MAHGGFLDVSSCFCNPIPLGAGIALDLNCTQRVRRVSLPSCNQTWRAGKVTIEISDFPSNSIWFGDFPAMFDETRNLLELRGFNWFKSPTNSAFSRHVWWNQRVKHKSKSHETIIFLWFSYGFHNFLLVRSTINHYKIPLKYHFPMVFLWFSYGFPMESPAPPAPLPPFSSQTLVGSARAVRLGPSARTPPSPWPQDHTWGGKRGKTCPKWSTLT